MVSMGLVPEPLNESLQGQPWRYAPCADLLGGQGPQELANLWAAVWELPVMPLMLSSVLNHRPLCHLSASSIFFSPWHLLPASNVHLIFTPTPHYNLLWSSWPSLPQLPTPVSPQVQESWGPSNHTLPLPSCPLTHPRAGAMSELWVSLYGVVSPCPWYSCNLPLGPNDPSQTLVVNLFTPVETCLPESLRSALLWD